MIGTVINVAAILIGGGLGVLFGERLPARMRETVINALGLSILAIGLKMTFESQNALITLGSLLLGGVLGEWWGLDDLMKRLGAWLELHFARSGSQEESARFIKGFVAASLVFCIGPMAILGSIENGLTGNFQLLAVKSVLDGFAALAFAASTGVGVLFSAIPILIYQGAITLLAGQMQALLSPAMIREMTAAGGVLVMGIGIGSLLELRPIRIANYLPALFLAPLITAILHALGIGGF